jgi:hypothetical protein
VIDQDQVRRLDFAERHAEGIHPETLRAFRVPHRDVTCHALGEAELAEEPEPGGELLLAVFALRLDRAEDRRLRQPAAIGGRTGYGGQARIKDARHHFLLAGLLHNTTQCVVCTRAD